MLLLGTHPRGILVTPYSVQSGNSLEKANFSPLGITPDALLFHLPLFCSIFKPLLNKTLRHLNYSNSMSSKPVSAAGAWGAKVPAINCCLISNTPKSCHPVDKVPTTKHLQMSPSPKPSSRVGLWYLYPRQINMFSWNSFYTVVLHPAAICVKGPPMVKLSLIA